MPNLDAIDTPPAVDPFMLAVNDLEAERARLEAESLAAQALDERNNLVISLGKDALAAGATQQTVTEQAWDLARNHLSTLREVGFATLSRPEGNRLLKGMNVVSESINIAADLALRLRVTDTAERTATFYTLLDREGTDHALDQYLSPFSCVISVFDRSADDPTHTINNYRLAPMGYAVSQDEAFRTEWLRFTNPFSGSEFQPKAIRGSDKITPTRVMHEGEIVYGAGLLALHKQWLEEVIR